MWGENSRCKYLHSLLPQSHDHWRSVRWGDLLESELLHFFYKGEKMSVFISMSLFLMYLTWDTSVFLGEFCFVLHNKILLGFRASTFIMLLTHNIEVTSFNILSYALLKRKRLDTIHSTEVEWVDVFPVMDQLWKLK